MHKVHRAPRGLDAARVDGRAEVSLPVVVELVAGMDSAKAVRYPATFYHSYHSSYHSYHSFYHSCHLLSLPITPSITPSITPIISLITLSGFVRQRHNLIE